MTVPLSTSMTAPSTATPSLDAGKITAITVQATPRCVIPTASSSELQEAPRTRPGPGRLDPPTLNLNPVATNQPQSQRLKAPSNNGGFFVGLTP